MGVRDREGGGVRKKERGRERKDGGVREREKGRVVHGGGIVKKSGEEWGSKGWKTGREGEISVQVLMCYQGNRSA